MYLDYNGQLLFGAHRYKNIKQVESSYLTWMLRTMEGLDARERAKIRHELHIRSVHSGPEDSSRANSNRYGRAHNRPSPPRVPSGVTPEAIREVVSAGRQMLAKRYHPDAGGSHERMVAVNAAADYLEETAVTLQEATSR